jgi:hypothetical protein
MLVFLEVVECLYTSIAESTAIYIYIYIYIDIYIEVKF